MNTSKGVKKILKSVPVHVAVIMDGNGRWAARKKLPRIMGHREGLKTVRRIVKKADSCGIKYLTLYSFSTENWKRPEAEIKFLFGLMEKSLREESENFHAKNVRVRFIGRRRLLPGILRDVMSEVEKLTFSNTGLTLVFAINYGGRQEIADAAAEIAAKGYNKGEVNVDTVEKHLYAPDIPAPDLIIRTSGEKRISNFLLWQAAYSELYFTPLLWPDFTEEDFLKALLSYQRRKRKYGGILK